MSKKFTFLPHTTMSNNDLPLSPVCVGRRNFLQGALAVTASMALPGWATRNADLDAIYREIEKRHDEAVQRLQHWIRQPSIAAENRGMNEGCDLTVQLLKDAGFGQVTKIPTEGQPAIFATLDDGARRAVAVYFMYDVKQVDPSEWSSPPWEAALVQKPGLGKVLVGRGAVNQKGPEASFLAALHAIRGVGRKLPVNLVLIAEGEEEIGSEHLPQVVRRPDVQAALARCSGIVGPEAAQGRDGQVVITLGAKGDIEFELVASGEHWGRGPRHDIHSSNAARVDSPAWHLIKALGTLVSPDGTEPAIEGLSDNVRPLSPAEKAMVADAAQRMDEAVVKNLLGVERWVRDVSWREALELYVSKPTINIEGLVGGYTGPGGKTILPHRAMAKIDMRLVPDMTADAAFTAVKRHLAKRGFDDIEVHPMGGQYGPTSTPAGSAIIRAETAVYRRMGVDPIVLPRSAGSWPGYVFTDPPLRLGSGAHAPDEYYLIESENPKVQGMDGAVRSFIEFFYELGSAA